jgi:hypothetical protein
LDGRAGLKQTALIDDGRSAGEQLWIAAAHGNLLRSPT